MGYRQFLPDRSLLVTADPYHPRRLRITISGPVPLGPTPVYPDVPPLRDAPTKPTRIVVTVQERDPAVASDLGWRDVAAAVASVSAETDGQFATEKYVALWSGNVQFAEVPRQGRFRLLIQEYEYISANWAIVHALERSAPPPVHR